MAITDYLEGMNDPRLKPRLLRSLVRDRLPEESGPAPSPSELSSILASIKTHSLLSEHVPDLSDAKLIEAWRTAVDAWIERVLSLASSKMGKFSMQWKAKIADKAITITGSLL